MNASSDNSVILAFSCVIPAQAGILSRLALAKVVAISKRLLRRFAPRNDASAGSFISADSRVPLASRVIPVDSCVTPAEYCVIPPEYCVVPAQAGILHRRVIANSTSISRQLYYRILSRNAADDRIIANVAKQSRGDCVGAPLLATTLFSEGQ